jgi:hypothetical protein
MFLSHPSHWLGWRLQNPDAAKVRPIGSSTPQLACYRPQTIHELAHHALTILVGRRAQYGRRMNRGRHGRLFRNRDELTMMLGKAEC